MKAFGRFLFFQQAIFPSFSFFSFFYSQLDLINLLERKWRKALHREVYLRASTDAEVRCDGPLRRLYDGGALVLELRGCSNQDLPRATTLEPEHTSN